MIGDSKSCLIRASTDVQFLSVTAIKVAVSFKVYGFSTSIATYCMFNKPEMW